MFGSKASFPKGSPRSRLPPDRTRWTLWARNNLRTPQTARVVVTVSPAPVEWSVGEIAIKPRNAHGRVQMTPPRITAWVRGPRGAMTSDGALFDASIDLDGLKPGEFQVPVSVVAPAHVGVVRLEPAEVTVRIR